MIKWKQMNHTKNLKKSSVFNGLQESLFFLCFLHITALLLFMGKFLMQFFSTPIFAKQVNLGRYAIIKKKNKEVYVYETKLKQFKHHAGTSRFKIFWWGCQCY